MVKVLRAAPLMVPPVIVKLPRILRFCALLIVPPFRFSVIPSGIVCARATTSSVSPAGTFSVPRLPVKLLPVFSVRVALVSSVRFATEPILMVPPLIVSARKNMVDVLILKLPLLINGRIKRLSTGLLTSSTAAALLIKVPPVAVAISAELLV